MVKKNETAKVSEITPDEQPDTVPVEQSDITPVEKQETVSTTASQEDPSKENDTNRSGFYIYIGPNIKGLIQTGTIYRGDRDNAFKMAAAAIEKQPKVKSLIVAGDALPEARLKVKTPGNILYANYMKLAGK